MPTSRRATFGRRNAGRAHCGTRRGEQCSPAPRREGGTVKTVPYIPQRPPPRNAYHSP